jgi:hypothetical protein
MAVGTGRRTFRAVVLVAFISSYIGLIAVDLVSFCSSGPAVPDEQIFLSRKCTTNAFPVFKKLFYLALRLVCAARAAYVFCLRRSLHRFKQRLHCRSIRAITLLALLLIGNVSLNPSPTNDCLRGIPGNSCINLQPSELQLISTNGDGHCLFHAVRISLLHQHGINLSTEYIIQQVRHELANNCDYYISFGFRSMIDYSQQVHHYLDYKILSPAADYVTANPI